MNREILRTKNFAADAANFIVEQAQKALGARGKFRIAPAARVQPTAGDVTWIVDLMGN